MSDRIRIGLVLVAAWVFALATIVAAVLLVGMDVGEQDRAALAQILSDRAPHLVVVALLLLAPLALILRALFRLYVVAPRKLAEDVRVMLVANSAHRARLRGSKEMRQLAARVNDLAQAREALRQDVDRRMHEANARIEQEKNRLAALMSELAQSVVVCNVEGRILLYNARAMAALAQAPRWSAGCGTRPQPGRAGAFDLRDLRSQPHHPRAGEHPGGRAQALGATGGELRRDDAGRPARPSADGAGAGAGGHGAGQRYHRFRAGSRGHHAAHREQATGATSCCRR